MSSSSGNGEEQILRYAVKWTKGTGLRELRNEIKTSKSEDNKSAEQFEETSETLETEEISWGKKDHEAVAKDQGIDGCKDTLRVGPHGRSFRRYILGITQTCLILESWWRRWCSVELWHPCAWDGGVVRHAKAEKALDPARRQSRRTQQRTL